MAAEEIGLAPGVRPTGVGGRDPQPIAFVPGEGCEQFGVDRDAPLCTPLGVGIRVVAIQHHDRVGRTPRTTVWRAWSVSRRTAARPRGGARPATLRRRSRTARRPSLCRPARRRAAAPTAAPPAPANPAGSRATRGTGWRATSRVPVRSHPAAGEGVAKRRERRDCRVTVGRTCRRRRRDATRPCGGIPRWSGTSGSSNGQLRCTGPGGAAAGGLASARPGATTPPVPRSRRHGGSDRGPHVLPEEAGLHDRLVRARAAQPRGTVRREQRRAASVTAMPRRRPGRSSAAAVPLVVATSTGAPRRLRDPEREEGARSLVQMDVHRDARVARERESERGRTRARRDTGVRTPPRDESVDEGRRARERDVRRRSMFMPFLRPSAPGPGRAPAGGPSPHAPPPSRSGRG